MKKALFVFMSGVLLVACSKSSDTTTPPAGGGGGGQLDCSTITTKSFSKDISTIIQTKCATNSNCHGSGSSNGPGELTSYTQIFNARVNIRSAVASGVMPKEGTITTAQKNSILCWVDGGGQDN